ncbi:MAG: hypothetical protein VKI81_05480 [Synechococcaceae cyanobacterium]|nr:hypothetical protein [Synechococcaceae cyanobacterium]
MNLMEVLVASVVLAFSSGAAMQASAEMARSMVRSRQLLRGMEQLEGELLRAERRLALAAEGIGAEDPRCGDPAGLLADLAAGGPGTVTVTAARAVTLRVEAPGGDTVGGAVQARERLLTPAALGLCVQPPGGGAP